MYGRSALIAVAAAGLAWAAADPVEVEVRGVQLDPTTGSPVVQLVEKGKAGRALPIWIGPFEAQAIAAEMQGMPLPRPLTHAAAVSVGATVLVLGGRGAGLNTQTRQILAISPSGAVALAGELPRALSDLAAVALGHEALLAGGRDAGGQVRAEILRVSVR